jgi:predicted nucleic acid-binding protein
MLVLDANILIRAVLGRRVRELLERYAVRGVRFLAPEAAFEEASKYLPMLLEKRGIPRDDVLASLSELRAIVEIVEAVEADFYRSFEQQARQLLRGRDEADWPILATALGLGCGLWTEDQDFFGTGVAVWTTNRIEIPLEQESSASGPERSELS